MKIAIIGGGLAGCALAWSLKQSGAQPVIYEASETLAAGASGHSVGLYNPRFSAQRTPQSDYYTAAFAMARRVFPVLDNIGWSPCGALHLITDEKKEKRYPQTVKNWGWESEYMRIVDAQDASRIAGVKLEYDALYLPDAGIVSPEKLCRAYVRGIETHLGAPVKDVQAIKDDADAVVLACGFGVKSHLDWIPLSQVRGQLTDVQATLLSEKLNCNLCYGGYLAPANDNGIHILGATFQRWLDHSRPLVEDNRDNIEKLAEAVPGLAKDLKVVGHRAALRTSTPDYFPVVGKAPGRGNLYISTGHGSHGIVSSLMAGQLLADMILGKPFSLGRDTVQALSPLRFETV